MRFSYIILIGFIVFCIWTGVTFLKPVNLANEVMVEIPYGSSVIKSGEILKNAGIIESKESYLILSKVLHPDGIYSGRYYFSGRVTIYDALNHLANGKFGRDQIRLTIPEGFTAEEVINRIYKLFPNIDKDKIQNSLGSTDGFIYPETYFFDGATTADELVIDLKTRSSKKISSLISPIKLNTKEAERIIIIASLVESEGKTKDERHTVAGIIENRLKIDMPLQLDATLQYITGRGSSELSLKDLKINSEYNTYIYKGLTPTPISNPGEESILAAMNPTKNDYLFYLHDNNGQIYYAKTFDEHVKNKNKYLK